MLDLTRPMSRVTFDDVAVAPRAVLGRSRCARGPALEHALDRARVALAAEQSAAPRPCSSMTTAYAKDRVQFGRPIGSFQAVKHRLADMMVEVEAARSAA